MPITRDADFPARSCNSDHGERTWARLRCRRGHEWDTHTDMTVSELQRGVPCPTCNGVAA